MKTLLFWILSRILKYKINWNPFHGKRVAVVGNAESLFHNEYGKLIDSYDIVCRFNHGNQIINSNAQGTKSTVKFFSVPFYFKDVVKNYIDGTEIVHISNRHRHRSISRLDTVYIPEILNNVISYKAKVTRPSSGLMALNYIDMCNPLEVALFGFDWKKTPTYYAKDRVKEPHEYQKEEEYVSTILLAKENFIIFEDTEYLD